MKSKKIKRTLTSNILIFPSRPALSSSKEEHRQIRHHQEHMYINPRLHTISKCLVWRVQIPQVVMNIDHKLQPIANKNFDAYFYGLDFTSNAKLLYHFKNNNFTEDICIFWALLRQ